VEEQQVLTVSRFVERFGEEHLAFPTGSNGPMAVRGHWLWCRRCRPVDPVCEDDSGNKLTIYMPERSKTVCEWWEVLAVGAKVGCRRECSKLDLRRRLTPRHMCKAYEEGDIILSPSVSSWGIIMSPYDERECLIDEAFAICKWEET